MIAVAGATGTIGRALLPLLAARAGPVRALSRRGTPPGGDEEGVRWVRADLADREGLPAALEGADRLFLLTGNVDGMVRLQRNALAAAAEVGVRHVVKLSALGATDHSKSVIGLWHHNVEEALKRAGPDWTILRPHHFMQNLLDPLVFDRAAGRIRSASGEGRIPFVDTRDIAAAAAEILTGAGHAGQTYVLTGPEARSYREATEVVARALGRTLAYEPETMDEAWRRRRSAGQPVWLAAAQLAIAGYQREGGATERTSDTFERLTGRAPGSLEDFAGDYRDALADPGRP